MYSPETTKYLIHVHLEAEGVVEKSDVIGAIFGQTEGLLGEDLDLRDLQRTGRVGRIDVQIASKKGETSGEILISSSLDKAETAILAASLETIDRVGPCNARVAIEKIEDIRITKRRIIIDRAKEILLERFDEGAIDSNELIDIVREYSRIEKAGTIGEEKLPAGPNVIDSDAIIVVEGQADVVNLLRFGIKNAVAVEGTKVPATIINLCESKTATAFLDGDRGGDLILSELLQVADIDYVAISPRGRSVEEMTRKEIVKALRNKVPVEFVAEQQADMGKQKDANQKSIPRPVPVGEDIRHSRAAAVVRKKQDAGQPYGPKTLVDHAAAVKGTTNVRFLSSGYDMVKEAHIEDLEKEIEALENEAVGLVTDGIVNQRLLDLLTAQGFEYIAARDFQGIIKKPVSVKLLKIP
ncbi:MAG TPA: DNA primase [Methanoculleus sp.]|nr:DNA primase [Methanoculleus sp.]